MFFFSVCCHVVEVLYIYVCFIYIKFIVILLNVYFYIFTYSLFLPCTYNGEVFFGWRYIYKIFCSSWLYLNGLFIHIYHIYTYPSTDKSIFLIWKKKWSTSMVQLFVYRWLTVICIYILYFLMVSNWVDLNVFIYLYLFFSSNNTLV